MARRQKQQFSGPVTVFHEQRLPERAAPAGYAALIDAYALKVPLPQTLAAIATRHKTIEADGWRLFTPRHAPSATLEGHLTFALKYEGVDLGVLKRLFLATGPDPVAACVRAQPTGSYARRTWFLNEWLTGTRLDLPDLKKGTYVEALNPEQQYAGQPRNSPRHRVRDNLPGTPDFCPLVRRTSTLATLTALDLAARAKAIAAEVPADLLARTAAFLLSKDSRASYVIEGEDPPQDRVQRWGRAIGQAGAKPIDLDELLRLQRIVIGDARFVKLGLRTEGGFVGRHDRDTRAPLPYHISARHDDLTDLISGMIAFDREKSRALDPVIAAAALAFGFVFAHPFEDGNGRIHRYLIHHVLAARGFNPPGVVFPVSATILARIDEYRKVLETYSQRVLPFVEWHATETGNVEVLNDTADYYRYFDATPQAEFLYACVRKTVEEDLPEETDYLRRYDAFRAAVEAIVEMPERSIDLLFRILRQNSGKLSKRARDKEFAALKPREITAIEAAYAAGFSEA
ncbi:MAG: Fic family protein [Hyphomicrobiaceae bacterium]|nr:MAG: Fic family protein [Hyphomicrobiaceae bacterium]